jgi:hypothetical protein
VVLTVFVAVANFVRVTVAVSVVDTVADLVTVEVTGADGLVMKQLHAELMRDVGKLPMYAGVG